jgi:hypothetical protein
MKTALVLGLALAANAYKTEQVETSIHIKGNNLDVKDWKDIQNLIPHGLKFDDQADDELHVAPRDKNGHRVPYKPGVKYDDEELHVAPHDRNGNRMPYRPHVMYDDQGDDELHIAPRDKNGHRLPYKPGVKYDDQVDDELVWYEKTRSGLPKIHFGERPKEDLKFHVGEGFKTVEKNRSGLPKLHLDEEGDNEYVSLPKDYVEILKTHKLLLEIHEKRAADDEFMNIHDQELYHQAPKRTSAKRELPKGGLSKPKGPKGGLSGPSSQGSTKQELPSGEFPKMILGSDNPGLYFLDDELALWHAPPKEFAHNPLLDKVTVALRVDDEADDELVYLRDLLKPERRHPIDVALPRDDELRVVENPNLRGGLERKHHTIILP